MPEVYDKRGIPIMVGDTLKVFHFVTRGQKRYMYKYVEAADPRCVLHVSHLNPRELRPYYLLQDDLIHPDIEIVQGYAGVQGGDDFRQRTLKPKE